MFGHNVPRPRDHKRDLQVHAVFHTIQGEGPFAGDPAVFIRLTGCNLRCWFCDTEWGDEGDPYQSPDEIAALAEKEAEGAATNLAVITGGEPTRQDLEELFKCLFKRGFTRIQVETAGTFWQDCLGWLSVTVVISPKTNKVHPNFRRRRYHWKYVIKAGEVDPKDGLPSKPMQRSVYKTEYVGGAPARPNAGDTVYLQPMDEHNGPHAENENIRAMLDSSLKFGYRAGLQLHKFFGLD